jgi:transcriptional regulator with XRE-family HTH domain
MATKRSTRRRRRPPLAAPPPIYPDLATYCEQTGDTQVNIAAQVGVSQSAISKVLNGDVVPRSRLALRLATYARIPLDSFQRVYLLKHAGRVA